ncbi:hypothetical protein NDU88_002202 [Pleurodeles waltl]|uniref:Myb-like domain-containing protein n=1 Tax=Pleurodeles waltl TaxID=8319 RepID=A0AAV7RC27_PLEWA|nr:hypothetical protein NDU88_002202 [Pleurodeles waltl]
MARVTGERAPAFTSEELEKLVDGVNANQKRGLWQAIAREVWTLGVYSRWSTHCSKRWEDLRHWARKTCEAQLGKSSQRGKGARRALTPLMRSILAVAYPDLDGRLKSAQQTQDALHVDDDVTIARLHATPYDVIQAIGSSRRRADVSYQLFLRAFEANR